MSAPQVLKSTVMFKPQTGLIQLAEARLGECAGASRHLVNVTTLRAPPSAVPLAAGRCAWYKGFYAVPMLLRDAGLA
jgi:hypothetical protein